MEKDYVFIYQHPTGETTQLPKQLSKSQSCQFHKKYLKIIGLLIKKSVWKLLA